MGPVVEIGRQKAFSLQDAQDLLPVILRVTRRAKTEVDSLATRLEAASSVDLAMIHILEEKIQSIVKGWQRKLKALGVHPKGMWLADFDNGKGYYCWKFPEEKVLYWHKYEDGFSKRRPLKKGSTPTALVASQFEETEAQASP